MFPLPLAQVILIQITNVRNFEYNVIGTRKCRHRDWNRRERRNNRPSIMLSRLYMTCQFPVIIQMYQEAPLTK